MEKIVVIGRPKESHRKLSAEKRLDLLEKSAKHMEKHQKAGKLEEMYFLPNMEGTVSVWEVEEAEGKQMQRTHPMSPHVDVEVYPFGDAKADNLLKQAKESGQPYEAGVEKERGRLKKEKEKKEKG